ASPSILKRYPIPPKNARPTPCASTLRVNCRRVLKAKKAMIAPATMKRRAAASASKKILDAPGTNCSCASKMALMNGKLIPQIAVAKSSQRQARKYFGLCMALRLGRSLGILQHLQRGQGRFTFRDALALAASTSQFLVFVK